jgi:hypothetical protein
MKTAMQELMDALNDLEAVYIQNDWRREVIGINQAKNLIEYIYLEKEKWQIMNAYDIGWLDCKNSDGKDLNDQYYFETFNTNEK